METKKPAVEKGTIGLDLGDRHHHACVLDEAGEILAEESIRTGQSADGNGGCAAVGVRDDVNGRLGASMASV